jgi:hypothetical protein
MIPWAFWARMWFPHFFSLWICFQWICNKRPGISDSVFSSYDFFSFLQLHFKVNIGLVSQFVGRSAGLPDRVIPSLKLWLSIYTLPQKVKKWWIWNVNFLRVASLKRYYVKLSFHFLLWLLSSLVSCESDLSNLSTRTSGCCRLPCSRVSEEKSDVWCPRSEIRDERWEIKVRSLLSSWMPDGCQKGSWWTIVNWDI